MIENWLFRGKVGELEEAEQHMTEATARFRQVMNSDDAAEAQNVPDIYLEPIRKEHIWLDRRGNQRKTIDFLDSYSRHVR